MTPAYALRIVSKAVESDIIRKLLAVDANAHELQGMDYPHAVNAAKQRKRLREALRVLAVTVEAGNAKG